MPELPDVVVYIEALERRIRGARLERVRVLSPFVLRSVDPPLAAAAGRTVSGLRRLGKRIVVGLESDLFLVLHLMIAGRLHWRPAGARPPGKIGLAAFDFATGTLVMTEAGTKKRAAIHLVRGEEALREHDPGGLEVLEADLTAFRAALLAEKHTLKRALTDARLFSGIGNAYSDEILHRACLSPVKLSQQLADEEIRRLFEATRATLLDWCERLRREAGDGFPEGVTAFREGMAVHGRYGKPCPACGAPVQRIVHAENATNYCARCQTGGRLLADRALSRLLKEDWPRTLEQLEERRLAVGRGARGVIPLVLPCDELVRPDEPFGGDDLLQGGEPVMVVAAPVVHFAARAGRRDLVGQVRRPLLPREEVARVERHGHAEGLRLPRLPEDGSFLIPWDLRQGRKIRRRHAPTDFTRDRGDRPRGPRRRRHAARPRAPTAPARRSGRCRGAAASCPAPSRAYRGR